MLSAPRRSRPTSSRRPWTASSPNYARPASPKTSSTAPADAYLAEFVYTQDSQSRMARHYGWRLATGMTVADVEEWPERLKKVTVDDIRAVARKYLVDKNSVTGILVAGTGSRRAAWRAAGPCPSIPAGPSAMRQGAPAPVRPAGLSGLCRFISPSCGLARNAG